MRLASRESGTRFRPNRTFPQPETNPGAPFWTRRFLARPGWDRTAPNKKQTSGTLRRLCTALTSATCAFWIICGVAIAQDSRPADLPPPTDAKYLQLEHHPSSQIDATDRSLIHAKQREINTEATFFGYDLNAGEWDYDESSCPAIPDQLILHYRRQFSGGAQSLFTALVPRSAGRVFVVPVLYRNATPFRSATGNERSIAVFNRVVPADIAAQAIDPNGKWLALALCYADIVYGNANVLERPGADIGLARAPAPLLRLSEINNARGIVFTDRNAPGEYLVFNLTLNEKGRVIAANAQQLSDYVAQVRNGADLREKPLPEGKEPKVKSLPPQQEPTVKPRPQ
jgi:hypothetical protein